MQADNNINDFENKVEFIYYHITKYGIDYVGGDFDITDETKSEEFIKKVHAYRIREEFSGKDIRVSRRRTTYSYFLHIRRYQ